MGTTQPDAFFVHLGTRFLKTAAALENLGKVEGLYNKLFNPAGVEIFAENVMQKATFKAKESALRKILERAKEEATALQQPAVAPPQTST